MVVRSVEQLDRTEIAARHSTYGISDFTSLPLDFIGRPEKLTCFSFEHLRSSSATTDFLTPKCSDYISAVKSGAESNAADGSAACRNATTEDLHDLVGNRANVTNRATTLRTRYGSTPFSRSVVARADHFSNELSIAFYC